MTGQVTQPYPRASRLGVLVARVSVYAVRSTLGNMVSRLRRVSFICLLAIACSAASARAEWTAAVYLGASHTVPATLTVDLTSPQVHEIHDDVHFESHSFESPQYFGYRGGWFPSADARVGIEGELTHLKVYAAEGALGPMVQRFSISHGLNLVLANVVWRTPLGKGVRLTARGGAGFAMPHGESQILGVYQEQYEISSVALQGAVGIEKRFRQHISAFGELKLTTASPKVHVSGGTIDGRYFSQHAAFGLGVWF